MRWLALTALLFVGICLAWLGGEGRRGDRPHGPGSSLDSDGAGLSLARAYLAGSGHATALLGRTLEQAALPQQGVLLRIQPAGATGWLARLLAGKAGADGKGGRHGEEAPRAAPGKDRSKEPADAKDEDDEDAGEPEGSAPAERSALLTPGEERWLEGGGRLVLAVDGGWGGLATAEPGPGLPEAVLPLLPGVAHLVPPTARALDGRTLAQAVTVVAQGGQPLVMRRAVGAGDLWVLACPEVLSNAHLAEADHLALLLALVGERRPVWFDEHVHGVDDALGVLELLRRHALGPLAAIGALVAALWFWRRRAILGPSADPWRDQRAEAVEGVDALAGLYLRALSRRDALDLYRQRLLREVILRTGQRPLAARATVERLTGGLRLPPGEPSAGDFSVLMHRLTKAFRSFRDEHRSRRP